MMTQRRWDEANWREFYLTNPLIFVYTATLIWGIFGESGELKNLFYVDQDSSILDINDEEIELEGHIGIVHPLQLTPEEITAWIEKFYELEISQPFPQLHRPLHRIPKEREEQTTITAYNGMEPKRSPSAIKSYLEKRGWQKEVVDGGAVVFYRKYPEYDLIIDLGIGGLYVYYDEGEQAEIYETTFGRISNYHTKVPLKDIPEIIYSELITDLESIVRG